MDCEKYEVLFTGWINKDLPPAELLKLEQHLSACKSCREELAAMKELWMEMGTLETPAPSENIQVKFHAMLDTFKEDLADKNSLWAGINKKLNSLWQWQPRMPMAYSLVIILVSF